MLSHGNINAGVAGIQVQYEVCVRKLKLPFMTDSALKRGEEGGKGGEV